MNDLKENLVSVSSKPQPNQPLESVPKDDEPDLGVDLFSNNSAPVKLEPVPQQPLEVSQDKLGTSNENVHEQAASTTPQAAPVSSFPSCPVCGKIIETSVDREVSAHIDECLTTQMLQDEKKKSTTRNPPRLRFSGGSIKHVVPQPPTTSMYSSVTPSSGSHDTWDFDFSVSKEPDPPVSFTCPYIGCGKNMDTAALIKHVLSEHASGVQTFACPICDFATENKYVVDSNTNLHKHMTMVHATDPVFAPTGVSSYQPYNYFSYVPPLDGSNNAPPAPAPASMPGSFWTMFNSKKQPTPPPVSSHADSDGSTSPRARLMVEMLEKTKKLREVISKDKDKQADSNEEKAVEGHEKIEESLRRRLQQRRLERERERDRDRPVDIIRAAPGITEELHQLIAAIKSKDEKDQTCAVFEIELC